MAVTWDWKSEIWWFPFPSLRLPLDILLFWNVFSGVLPFRLMIFFLFLFCILSSGWPHCGWQVGRLNVVAAKQNRWTGFVKQRFWGQNVPGLRLTSSTALWGKQPPGNQVCQDWKSTGHQDLLIYLNLKQWRYKKNTHKFGFSMFCVLFTYLLLFFACAFACVRWGFSIRSWLSWTRWA